MTPPSPPMFCSECGRAMPPDNLARFGDRLVCFDCKAGYAQKLREGVPAVGTVRFAGFWIRFVAYIIDAIILFAINSIFQFALMGKRAVSPFPDPAHPEFSTGLMAVVGLSWLIGIIAGATYEGLFISRMGATPGKMALGLKVVRPGGGPVSLGRAVGRYFGKVLSTFTLGIGFIIAGFDSEKRGLHDMICDTRVIQTR